MNSESRKILNDILMDFQVTTLCQRHINKPYLNATTFRTLVIQEKCNFGLVSPGIKGV